MPDAFTPIQKSSDHTCYCLGGTRLAGGEWLDLQLAVRWVRGRYEFCPSPTSPARSCAFLNVHGFLYRLADEARLRFSSPAADPSLPFLRLYQEAEQLVARLRQSCAAAQKPVMDRPELRQSERLAVLLARAQARQNRRRRQWHQPDEPPPAPAPWVPLWQEVAEWRSPSPVRYFASPQAELAVWRGFWIAALWHEDTLWTGWYWPVNGQTNPCRGTPAHVALAAEYSFDPNGAFDAAQQLIDAQWEHAEQAGRFWTVSPPPTSPEGGRA